MLKFFNFLLLFFFFSFYSYSQKVLILNDQSIVSNNTNHLKTYLETNGCNVTISSFPEYQFNGTNENLNNYDCVIHFNGESYSQPMNPSGQTALLNYVKNGGGYIGGEWLAYEIEGHSIINDLILFNRTNGFQQPVNLSKINNNSTHPLLDGIPNTFSTNYAGNVGDVKSFSSYPVTVLMQDDASNNNPALAFREFENGKIVFFSHATGNYFEDNFGNYFEDYLIYSDQNILKLYLNAVRWVSSPTFANPGPVTICEKGSYFLDPSTTTGTWLSSDPSVATVDAKGYVTGLTPGTTTISLENSGGAVSASINVGSSSELSITDPLAQASYKINNNPQGPIGGTINYVGYNGFNYSSQTRPINTGFYRASIQSGNEAGCPTQFYIYRCTTCGTVPSYGTRPEGTLTGNTIQSNGTGQLVYNSSNDGVGPFSIVYQLIGGETKTVTNVSSGQAFDVAEPGTLANSSNYKLISVTDETTKASTDFANVIGTITVVSPPTATISGELTICSGATADLSVAITGTGAVTVTLNDGTVVTFPSGTISGTISVTPASNTTYTISSVVDVSGTGTFSGTASVTINNTATPVITVQPVGSVTIDGGTSTTLSVTATGAMEYQWYHDGIAIEGANTISYTTVNTVSATGTYYVMVYGACNTSVSSTNSLVDIYTPVDGSIEFSPTTPADNQYLSIPASNNYVFTSDFTVECWVNFKNVSGNYQSFLGQHTGSVPWVFQLDNNGILRVYGTAIEVNTSNRLSSNTWYHIALVRSGTSVNIYVNGVNNGSATIASAFGNETQINTIGSGDIGGSNDRFDGFISNVRYVKGTAVYTSNFTPPTSRLTAIQSANANGNPSAEIPSGHTTLLLNTSFNSQYLKDNSIHGATITNKNGVSTTTGLATSSSFNPF